MVAQMIEGWNLVIGIEIHAQVNSKSKLFSSSIHERDVVTSIYDEALVTPESQDPVLESHFLIVMLEVPSSEIP